LTNLDEPFYSHNKRTLENIITYIRKHPAEVCVDENGEALDPNYSGVCKTFFPDNTISQIRHHILSIACVTRQLRIVT
ncbi:MAG: hypothetical protein WKF89_05220, partial [Chitinophagaceae bacterium]